MDVFDKFVKHLETRPVVPMEPAARKAFEEYKRKRKAGQAKMLTPQAALEMTKKIKIK